jgi:two-component system, cell cycle sensor histidine kinase and response regulator CckA
MTRILIVDDILENRYLLEVLLRGYGYEVLSEANGAEALKIAHQFLPDLVIADILMPVMDGYSLCRSWKADPELCHIPFIFYTATYTEQEDEEFALSLGAERFVIKPQEPEELDRIVREVLEQHQAGASSEGTTQTLKQESEYLEGHNRALFRKLEKKMTELEQMNQAMSLEKAERRRLEEALIQCGEKIRNLLDASPLAIIWMDMQGTILFANRTFVDLFGYRTDDIPHITALFNRACPDSGQRAAMVALWDETIEEADAENWATAPAEVLIACKDGTLRQVSVVNAVITDIRLAIFNDLTVNKQLESQLMHAQKMEMVGQMAGGVAHDLNNILTAIVGYGHLLMTKLPAEEPTRKYVEQILRASDRASNLTGSICAFSRKRKVITAKPVRLNEIVRDADSLLRRLIPENVELKTVLLAEDVTICADPGQIEQVLMNLVINARDAVNGKGVITIGTALTTSDEKCTNAGGLETNATYALLTVDDTGRGMDEITKERIFEPFFTTKDMGKGTGLGLSVVHEIVKLHHGVIKVLSEPHKGTRFSIYLPVV